MKKKYNPKILFIHRSVMPSFVKNDLQLLKRHFFVYQVCLSRNALETLHDLLSSIMKTNIIFVWFAGFQAFISVFLAKFFRKKLVVVAGGYDAAYAPEINYGVFTCWWRKIMAFFIYKNVDLVLAVSRYTKRELLQRVTPKKTLILYNGVDVEKFTPFGEKEKLVLTVGNVNWSNIRKKGLKTFVEVAKCLSGIRFVLVGRHVDNSVNYLAEIAGRNVEFTGQVSFNKLFELYRRAMVYAQLSYHESFGVSLAEAMACGCVPVITKRTALPEVASECGIYVAYDDIKSTAQAIKRAFKMEKLKILARKRIVNVFSLENRERKLAETLINQFK
jgi:glycosyltransferase involved in cell wall biosynthesis